MWSEGGIFFSLSGTRISQTIIYPGVMVAYFAMLYIYSDICPGEKGGGIKEHLNSMTLCWEMN